MKALYNDTWDIVYLPKGKSSFGCKWGFAIKYKVDGQLYREI